MSSYLGKCVECGAECFGRSDMPIHGYVCSSCRAKVKAYGYEGISIEKMRETIRAKQDTIFETLMRHGFKYDIDSNHIWLDRIVIDGQHPPDEVMVYFRVVNPDELKSYDDTEWIELPFSVFYTSVGLNLFIEKVTQ